MMNYQLHVYTIPELKLVNTLTYLKVHPNIHQQDLSRIINNENPRKKNPYSFIV